MKTTALATALAGMLLLAPPLAAQSSADPPGRVGRLSFIEGSVSLHGPGQDQWSPAAVNYPVTTGDGFWTDAQSRAEIEVGTVDLRLDQQTEADILRLDDSTTRLRVDQGTVNVHVVAMPPGGIVVLTPIGEVDLLAPGSYHVEAGEPGPGNVPPNRAVVSVLQGRARVAGPRSTLTVEAGESAIVGANPPTFSLAEAEATPFDDWALERERRPAQPTATAWYVPPTMTGHEDLDRYGQWTSDPVYGPVWYPAAVPVGWAPYRFGHWAWIPPWGWTWIDDAPWGFAPFHYGRWAFIHDRWAWCPGAWVARPVYAPALVAFIGGGGFGIGVALGEPVAWVPLAPGEVFRPWYRVDRDYDRRVNDVRYSNRVTVNVFVNNSRDAEARRFRNARAATVVPARAFAGAAPVQHAVLHVDQDRFDRARMTTSLAHVQPTVAARRAVAHPEAASPTAVTPERHTPAPPATAIGKGAPPPTHATPPTVMRGGEHPPSAAPEVRTAAPPHPPAPAQQARPAVPPPVQRQATATPHVAPAIPHPFAVAPRPEAHKLPPAAVRRPVQSTRITPTPQGWQRAPVKPAATRPSQPAHPAPPAHAPAPGGSGGRGGEHDKHP